MLIIFDLDDTLIETSKCLTPFYLKWAFEAMCVAGLRVGRNDFNRFLKINAEALSSKIALQTFCQMMGAKEEILEQGLKALFSPLPSGITLDLVPGALTVLDTLQKKHELALVTAGDEELQLQKMKKAGIQPQRFSKLVVSKGSDKMVEYERILSELKVTPEHAAVCGDRVSSDLTPAKELGLFTVHFKNGRGLFNNFPKSSIDLSIATLNELCEVFCKNEN